MPRDGDRPLQRLTQACDYCRARKIKCDLRRPSCANCENRSLLCRFSTQQRKRGPRPASEINQGEGSHNGSNQTVMAPQSTTHFSSGGTHRHHPSYSASRSPLSSDDNLGTQHASPASSAHSTARLTSKQDSTLSPEFTKPQNPHVTSAARFATIYLDLEREVENIGLGKSMPSLARSCVNHFFDCLYPLMPIVYRPKIELGLCLLQPGIERREVDLQVFTLTVALCGISAAIIPSTIFSEGSLVADKFYRASKRSLELYRETEQPTSSSIAIRYFQSGYTHSVGQPRTTWDELESAIALAQVLRLHEETSYARMDEVESQLCRRLFWVLFTGDKSAGILGKHRITLGRYLLESGITVQYSNSLEGEDPIVPSNSVESLPRLVTGFNLNQDLWRAAYLVLLETDALRDRCRGLEDTENQNRATNSRSPTLSELSHLSNLYTAFETCLSNAPTCLRANPTLSLSPATFYFGQENENTPPPFRAFALQRINLQVSYQCLRLVVVQAMAASCAPCYTISPLWPTFLPPNNPSPGFGADCPSPELMSEYPTHSHEFSALLLQKARIAEDMLQILHTSSLENLRLNGESCVEKIRLVGAAMLEIIDHHADSLVAGIAGRFKVLYPHILAHLRSKASDSLTGDA